MDTVTSLMVTYMVLPDRMLKIAKSTLSSLKRFRSIVWASSTERETVGLPGVEKMMFVMAIII